MALRLREEKELAHCHTANKWQNYGFQRPLYSESPHSHHAVPSAKNAFPSLNC